MRVKPKHLKPPRHKPSYYVVVCSLACVLLFGVGSTASWLVSQATLPANNFNGGQLSASVAETFDGTTKSNVKVQNTGTIPAYMRATYVANFVDSNGNVFPKELVAGTDYTITLNTTDWTQKDDGYYYSNAAVAAGEQSAVFINQCVAVSGKAPAGYHLEVNVMAHALQQGGNASDNAWQALPQAAPATTDLTDGMTFSADTLYKAQTTPSAAVLTFEAVVKIPPNPTNRCGAILSNYSATYPFVAFEIGHDATHTSAPRLYYCKADASDATDARQYYFENASLADGEWHHIAVIVDTTAKRKYCYLDGKAYNASVLDDENCAYASMIPGSPFYLGGDARSGNTQYFKGTIRSVALFGDVRSQAEVKEDAARMFNAEDFADTHKLLAYYDCLNATDTRIPDISGNNNHMIKQ